MQHEDAMRYAITTLVVFLVLSMTVIAMGARLRSSIHAEAREILREWQRQGELPPDYDVDSGEFRDMGTDLGDSLRTRILLVDTIEGAVWLWMPMCLAAALLLSAVIVRWWPLAK